VKAFLTAGLLLLGFGGWLAWYAHETLNPEAAYLAVPIILFGCVSLLAAGVLFVSQLIGT